MSCRTETRLFLIPPRHALNAVFSWFQSTFKQAFSSALKAESSAFSISFERLLPARKACRHKNQFFDLDLTSKIPPRYSRSTSFSDRDYSVMSTVLRPKTAAGLAEYCHVLKREKRVSIAENLGLRSTPSPEDMSPTKRHLLVYVQEDLPSGKSQAVILVCLLFEE